MTSSKGSVASDNWLQPFLEDSVKRGLCTTIFCTTCGAREFRSGLANAAAMALRNRTEVQTEVAREIARALTEVKLVGSEPRKMESAVRLVLHEIWRGFFHISRQELRSTLSGSWPGEILARMEAHERAREAARKASSDDADRARVRKEERRKERQESHRKRLALKVERDRIWREKQYTEKK